MNPHVYIPNFNGGERLLSAVHSLAEQTRPVRVLVVDNGSTDDSADLAQETLGREGVFRLGENLGFGPAINRAVAAFPGDPVILLNNDAVCEPRFIEALLDEVGEGTDSVAGVLVQERAPSFIDSAGVVADRTLMGFDYLHGELVGSAFGAPAPLGPTGGAALYRHGAFTAIGGFDERIFLYYEDLDLALRMAAAGGQCRLAPEARAVHAYSASLGANSAAKFAHTGWGRGYLLRRYGVMSKPRNVARVFVVEGAICAGQLLLNHTSAGAKGRLRGWRAGHNLEKRKAVTTKLIDISLRQALNLRRRRHHDD